MPSDAVRQSAIKVFVRGFCFTRSFTHPYVPAQVGKMWVLRDAPRSTAITRTEEWIASGLTAAEIDGVVRRRARGNFLVCALVATGETADSLREDMKMHGYRLRGTETLMIRSVTRIPKVAAPVGITRVATAAMADRLTRAARCRLILPEHVAARERAPLRAYVAVAQDRLVGWVRSVTVGRASWVANMYVAPPFRRRGIGRAMLAAMLRDDRRAGVKRSVLLATYAGEKLYAAMGYETIGTLYLFRPTRGR